MVEAEPEKQRLFLHPDSLKLSSQLVLLKSIHATALRIHEREKTRTFFIRGVQGEVSQPAPDRDYLYLNGNIKSVRMYLQENCVTTVCDELFQLALHIFSLNKNRRRMGVELTVLAMLGTSHNKSFELPEKYYSHCFVIDMLVSCRHRFQKPDVTYFWSKQSEALLLDFLKQATSNLTRLSLPLCNDLILKSISVQARHLEELEVQLSLDCTDEGLLAIAGKTLGYQDRDLRRSWNGSASVQKDNNGPSASPPSSSNNWFVKDSILFTNPQTSKRILPPTPCDKLPTFGSTGFGCKKLVKMTIRGDFIFPPVAYHSSSKLINCDKGPIIEVGIYGLLLGLPRLRELSTGFTPVAISRLYHVLDHSFVKTLRLPIKSLSLAWGQAHTGSDLQSIGQLCPGLSSLSNVNTGCVDDDSDDVDLQLCTFIREFRALHRISFSVPLSCLNNFLARNGDNISVIRITTAIYDPKLLLLTRKYAPNVENFEGRFMVVTEDNGDYYSHHGHRETDRNGIDDLAKAPWNKLKCVDLKGRLNLLIVQMVVANAEHLEVLSVNSVPHESSNDGIALSDEWLMGLVEVNPLHNVRELSLRMDSDCYVEDGSFSKAGLVSFLNHACDNCPKLSQLVGEFTRISEQELRTLEMKSVARGLKKDLTIRNAQPYRGFQNSDDNDIHYGLNWRYLRDTGGGGPMAAVNLSSSHCTKTERTWGYVFRPYNPQAYT